MIRFTWGLLIGLVVGGVVALALFAEPLCRRGVKSKLGSLFDGLGLDEDNPIRGVAEGIFN